MFRLLRLIKRIAARAKRDEVTALAAQLTYYLILSFFPFLIFLLTLLAYTPLNREHVIADIITVLPPGSQSTVRDIFTELLTGSTGTLLSFGMIAAIWTSSNGMMAIIRTLNKAYDEEEHRPYWKVRLLSILYTVAFTLAALLAFLLLIFGQWLSQWAYEMLEWPYQFEQWWSPLKYLLSLTLLCVIFSLLYYSAPSRRLAYKEVIPGAVFATAGWIAASSVFSVYVSHFGSFTRTYGSIGGIIALLVWLYISSIILLLGGVLNAVISTKN